MLHRALAQLRGYGAALCANGCMVPSWLSLQLPLTLNMTPNAYCMDWGSVHGSEPVNEFIPGSLRRQWCQIKFSDGSCMHGKVDCMLIESSSPILSAVMLLHIDWGDQPQKDHNMWLGLNVEYFHVSIQFADVVLLRMFTICTALIIGGVLRVVS